MYECDICQLTTEKLYNVNDEALCSDCFNEAVSQAEYYFEMQREEAII